MSWVVVMYTHIIVEHAVTGHLLYSMTLLLCYVPMQDNQYNKYIYFLLLFFGWTKACHGNNLGT